MKSEIIKNLTFAEYQEIDAINLSTLKEFYSCPLRWRLRELEGLTRKPSKSMEFGSLVDAILTGQSLDDYMVLTQEMQDDFYEQALSPPPGIKKTTAKSFSTNLKVFKKWKEKNSSKLIVTQKEWDDGQAAAAAAKNHPEFAPYLQRDHDWQVAIVWKEPEFKVWCKGLIDFLPGDVRDPEIDLKTGKDVADPRQFSKQVFNLRYDMQRAFYQRGLQVIGQQRTRAGFLTVDNTRPFVANYGECPGSWLIAGADGYQSYGHREPGWRDCLKRWLECKATNKYPNYSGVLQTPNYIKIEPREPQR